MEHCLVVLNQFCSNSAPGGKNDPPQGSHDYLFTWAQHAHCELLWPGYAVVCCELSTFYFKHISSKTSGPNCWKLCVGVPCMKLYQNYSNNSIPCRTLVAMATNWKNLLYETTLPGALNFCVRHPQVDLYQDCSNYVPGVESGPATGVTCFI